MSSMNNKVTTSPPSTNKSRSNSTSVQHDQIPINSSSVTHSSASYKQELMDSSVLLDNINEALSIWDNAQSNSHTLPSFINNPNLFSPSLSSTNNTNNNNNNQALISTQHIPKHHHTKKRRNSHHKRHKRHNNNDNNNNNNTTTTNTFMGGPHQTYYMKDDTLDRVNNKQKKSKTKRRHHMMNAANMRRYLYLNNIDDIPSFVLENDRRLNLLGEMIELKRNELERISGRHDYTLSCIINLYISATASVVNLRKQHRDLSSFAEQLSREGQIRNNISDNILSTLHNIEEQRKNLLNKIESPSWEIRHHFHILSFEHFRGNQQPHLLEIAQVLPCRLQIAAISHQSSNVNDKLLSLFNTKQKERDLLYKKLSQIDKKRNLTQCHLKDYKKMMTIIKKNIGEKRLNKLKKGKEIPMGSSSGISPPNVNIHVGVVNIKKKDRFRRQYLSGIGITIKEKKKFNLVEFVTQINKYLCLSPKETKKELSELKNNNDLINPITGQINNPSDKGNKEQEDNIKGNKQEEEMEIKIVKNEVKKEFVFKEKPQRQNILNIIDRNKFVINEEKRRENENIVKTVYCVSLKGDYKKNKAIDDNDEDKEVDDEDDDMDDEDINYKDKDKDMIDAPHRDWSVLAKHLKDSSKEQARRKQILKQLERILHVREGLIVGFEQLKEIYNNYQNKKIQK